MSNNKFNIIIDNSVYKKLKKIQDKEKNPLLMLRIRVEGGGCAGFSYKYDTITEIKNNDYIAEKDGIKIVIDSISQKLINDCIVEYIEELGKSYFKITNPLAQSKCGCGNSFSI